MAGLVPAIILGLDPEDRKKGGAFRIGITGTSPVMTEVEGWPRRGLDWQVKPGDDQ